MLDPVTGETIYASNGDDVHESEDTGNEEGTEDNNFESNLRRRKGKIISCAKETIEHGTVIFYLVSFLRYAILIVIFGRSRTSFFPNINSIDAVKVIWPTE